MGVSVIVPMFKCTWLVVSNNLQHDNLISTCIIQLNIKNTDIYHIFTRITFSTFTEMFVAMSWSRSVV